MTSVRLGITRALAATASASDGTIARVEFYRDHVARLGDDVALRLELVPSFRREVQPDLRHLDAGRKRPTAPLPQVDLQETTAPSPLI